MRIIAGKHGSRRIETLKGRQTRPTSSKVRAAIFDHYGTYFEKGRFLDVFAGSGAMSFEAISRGFHQATLIEKDHRAFKLIRKNIQNLQLHDETQVYRGDALKVLPRLKETYDLIFIDPPYAYEHAEQILEKIITLELLSPKGYCVFETDQTLAEQYPGLKLYQYKEYGDTKVYFYQRA